MMDGPGTERAIPGLPAGTVTFLFTDIEGSTKLLERLREQYAALLAEQRHLLRAAFARWNGHEMDTQGDAFFVAFPRALDAAKCVVEAQRELTAHAWPEDVAVRVRMGLHTGEPWSGREGYVGMDVHRAARIAHVGHGGQVLLSETTVALVRDGLPAGVSLLDLGRHLLKDIRRPEHICQLQIEGLPAEFPPLRTLATLPPVGARLPRPVGACPYRGLSAFREADAPFYCGREAFVDLLEGAVRRQALTAVIVGSSGSGKSSALFAGLLPRLRKEGRWQFALLRPGSQPFYALAAGLLPLLEPGLSETDRLTETRKLAERLARKEVSLAHVIERIREKAPEAGQILLVVYQFEELYTLCPDAETQQAFIDELLAAALAGQGRRTPLCAILLTLRADFMGQALAYRPFADALQEGSVLMGPMTRGELRAAIEKPAEMQGAAFEAGLVERILDDVGEKPGNLPLLEFTLTLLWERQTDGWLTHTHYEAMGSVEGALATYADQVYAELGAGEQERTRRALVQLVRPGEGTEDTRRVATREELGEDKWHLVQHLADRRLVVTGRDAAGDETAEVVHEALIQRWGRFREWMDADRAFRAWQERLRGSLRGWQESGRDEGALLSGGPLLVAENWLAERGGDLSKAEAEYIREGQALQGRRQRERERRRQRTVLALAAGLVVLAALGAVAFIASQRANRSAATARAEADTRATAVVAARTEANSRATAEAMAGQEREVAQAQARLATSREVAAAAVNSLQVDPERSVLLALQALSTADTLEARNALRQALPELHSVHTIAAHGPGGSPGVAFSPDGARLASVGLDGTAKVWDAATGELVLTLSGQPDRMGMDIAFSPDGRLLAAPWASQVLVWDAASGERLLGLPGQAVGGQTNRIEFSPDGTRLAVANMDGRPKVWDMSAPLDASLTGGRELFKLAGHAEHCEAIAFSPDGARLATGDITGIVKLWDAATGQERLTLQHGGNVHGLAFSPDGRRLAAAGEDGRLLVWDSDTQQLLLSLPGRSGIYDVTYTPDGQRLVSVHHDGATSIWDAVTGQPLLTLAGHLSTVVGVAASPDNIHIATSGYDSTVRLWDTRPGRELLTVVAHASPALDIAYSPDGSLLATAGADGNAKVWDPASGLLAHTLFPGADTSGFCGVAFSPDGRRVAAGGADGTVLVGDAATGQVELTLLGHANMVFKLAFSPDGRRLATGSWDLTAKVWDLATGEEIVTFAKHSDLVMGLTFSLDGQRVFTGGDRYAREWDAATGQELRAYYGDGLDVYDLALSPDGGRLAMGRQDGSVTVWDLASSDKLLQLSGHNGLIARLAFSPDGARLATGSFDKLAKVWDAQTGQELMTLYGNTGNVFGVSFSPDGRHVATAGGDGTMRIYTLDMDELTDLARSRLQRSLTTAECRQYLHLEGCP
ncbi:MAG: adenylate/guanylate cyclase domain-containing protein [Chloroflexota bacterium]